MAINVLFDLADAFGSSLFASFQFLLLDSFFTLVALYLGQSLQPAFPYLQNFVSLNNPCVGIKRLYQVLLDSLFFFKPQIACSAVEVGPGLPCGSKCRAQQTCQNRIRPYHHLLS